MTRSRRGLSTPASPGRRDRAALLVDVWYTLVYYTPVERARVERARHELWVRAFRAAGLSLERALEAAAHVERSAHSEELRGRTLPLRARVERVARRLGISLDSRHLTEAFDRVVHADPPRVAPGARAALRRIRAEGVRVGVVSNVVFETAEGARRLLKELGLRELLDAVALSADDGIAKPDPRPFRRCLGLLDVPPGRAWYVGDMPTDVVGARAAGLRPIRFAGFDATGPFATFTGRTRARPAAVVRRWSEIPNALAYPTQRLLIDRVPTRPERRPVPDA